MLNAPSGVGIYWVASTVFSLFSSYYVYGRTLNWRQILLPGPAPAATPEPRAKRVREARSRRKQQEPESEEEPPERDGRRRPLGESEARPWKA